jgi:hypothetical protein
MYYVAVDIGCIECGEPSAVIGIYKKRSDAEKAIADHKKRQEENWKGQHVFEVFEIERLNKTYEVDY